MTITFAIIVVSLLAIGSFLMYARSGIGAAQNSSELVSLSKPIDMTALSNLLDPAELLYLRDRLSKRDFNKLERLRSRVLIGYVNRIAYNAGLLIGLAHHLEGDVASASELLSLALRVRLQSFWVIALLYVKVLLPSITIPAPELVQDYEAARRALPQGISLS